MRSKYKLDNKEVILKCRSDKNFLGEAMLANEKLIWHSIHKYIGNPDYILKNSCFEKDDLLQVGRIGFIKAIKAFDYNRGVKFSSFAVVAIVREVKCYLRDYYNIIRPTRTANDLATKIKRLIESLGYQPPPEQIAEIFNISIDKVIKVLQVGQRVRYLEEPINDYTLMDTIEDKVDIEHEIVNQLYIENTLKTVKKLLSEDEKRILELNIGGMNQTQIAKQENISQMKVSRVMRKIICLIEENQKHLL